MLMTASCASGGGPAPRAGANGAQALLSHVSGLPTATRPARAALKRDFFHFYSVDIV